MLTKKLNHCEESLLLKFYGIILITNCKSLIYYKVHFKVQQGLLQVAIIINTNCDTIIARCFLFLGTIDLSSLICSFLGAVFRI